MAPPIPSVGPPHTHIQKTFTRPWVHLRTISRFPNRSIEKDWRYPETHKVMIEYLYFMLKRFIDCYENDPHLFRFFFHKFVTGSASMLNCYQYITISILSSTPKFVKSYQYNLTIAIRRKVSITPDRHITNMLFFRYLVEMSSSSPRAPRRAGCRTFSGPERELLGSCWAQKEQPNIKGIYVYCRARCWAPGSEMNSGFYAGHIQKMCGAGSVPGPDFGENFDISNPYHTPNFSTITLIPARKQNVHCSLHFVLTFLLENKEMKMLICFETLCLYKGLKVCEKFWPFSAFPRAIKNWSINIHDSRIKQWVATTGHYKKLHTSCNFL